MSTQERPNGVSHTSVGANGSQANCHPSLDSAIMQPGTLEAPQTNGTNASSQMSGKDMRQDRTQPAAPLNYVNRNKDEVAGLASAGGSAPTSPWDQ